MENVRGDFDKRPYQGGYRFMKEELVRTGILKHTTELDRPVSEETLQALNAVQRTPWKINKRVLAVMREAYLDKSEIAGIPYADSKPVPSKSDDEWERMSDEEKTEWRKFLSEIHGENARTESRRHGFVSRLKMAEELQDREAIWFPHFLDFRTRFYPMVQDLHPQGDDSTKALLCFAEGKRLGKRGLYWLGARLAACYGLDKLHPDERFQWALDNHEMIVDCANRTLVEETGAASPREILQLLVDAKPEFTDEEKRLPNLDGEQLDGAMKIVAFLQRFLVASSHKVAVNKVDEYLIDVYSDAVSDLEDDEVEELNADVNDFLRLPTTLLSVMHELQTAMFIKGVIGDEATLEEVACAVSA